MKFTSYTRKEDVTHKWYEINAEGKTLGRLATTVANILRGKNKPSYTPSVDCGDYVVVVNAEKIVVSGNKTESKKYYRYSGYQSGLKTTTFKEMLVKHPDHIITHAVKGMLPKNVLSRQILKKLKVYAGPNNPHTAQNVEKLEI